MASSNVQKQKRRTGDNRRKVECVATVRDPHHDMRAEWGITAEGRLYHRVDAGVGPWQKVNRISYTPNRILVLAWLVQQIPTPEVPDEH